ncbi:Hypothetical predicted protein [Lecanosticta acicola]|uniref:Uncharacterized protein n=1 Tax=Lecanosticta acicola TaxID=111012 RepID=A0AAI8Z598_9PEZI|nr:Hypothetical predicted protein [Lecanosticta acicola]
MPLKCPRDEMPEIDMITQIDDVFAGGIEHITALLHALRLFSPEEGQQSGINPAERIQAQEAAGKKADDFLTSAKDQRIVLLRALRQRLKRLNDEYDRMDRANAEWYEREGESQAMMQSVEAENSRLKREMGEVKKKRGFVEEEKQDRERSGDADVENKNEHLRQKLTATERRVGELEGEMSGLVEDRERIVRELQDSRKAEGQLRDLHKAKLERHQTEIRNLWDVEIEPRKMELVNLREELDGAKAENRRLQQDVQDAKQLARSQDEENARLRSRISELTTHAAACSFEASRRQLEWTTSQGQMERQLSDLKQQLQEEKNCVHKLRDQVSVLEGTIDSASTEHSRQEKDWLSVKTRLDGDISGLTQHNVQLAAELSAEMERRLSVKTRLEGAISGLNQHGVQLAAEKKDWLEIKSTLEGEVSGLSQHSVQLAAEKKDWLSVKAKLEAGISGLTQGNSQLAAEVVDLRKTIASAQKEKDSVERRRCREAEDRAGILKDLQTEKEKSISAGAEAGKQVHALEMQLAQKVKETDSEVSSIRHMLAEYEQNTQNERRRVSSLRDKLAKCEQDAQEKVRRLRSNKAALEANLEAQKVREEVQQQQGTLLEAELDKQKTKASTLDGQVALLKGRTQELKQDNLTAARQLEASSASERNLRDQIRQLKANRIHGEADMQDLREKLHRAQAAEGVVRVQLQKLVAERDDHEEGLRALRNDINFLEIEKCDMAAVKESLREELAACQADLENVRREVNQTPRRGRRSGETARRYEDTRGEENVEMRPSSERGIPDTGRTRRRRLVPLNEETLRKMGRQ